jgi:hypothetical protein
MTDAQHWHLKREVTIGNIVMTFSAIIAIIAAYYSLDTRLTVLEGSVKHNKEDIAKNQQEVIRKLERIEDILLEGK